MQANRMWSLITTISMRSVSLKTLLLYLSWPDALPIHQELWPVSLAHQSFYLLNIFGGVDTMSLMVNLNHLQTENYMNFHTNTLFLLHWIHKANWHTIFLFSHSLTTYVLHSSCFQLHLRRYNVWNFNCFPFWAEGYSFWEYHQTKLIVFGWTTLLNHHWPQYCT